MNHTFAIGDIHGCLDQLVRLVDILPISEGDRLVFIGDYIDRGPRPMGVIDYLLGLDNAIFLRGNHEEMMLLALCDAACHSDMNLWLSNGGWQTFQEYSGGAIGGNFNVPADHIDFLNGTIPFFETDDYIFVHAGANPTVPMERHPPDYFLWVRDEFIDDESDWPKTVVFGHTPQDKPLVMNNKIGIDTGCVFGGKLTAVQLPEVRFYQA